MMQKPLEIGAKIAYYNYKTGTNSVFAGRQPAGIARLFVG